MPPSLDRLSPAQLGVFYLAVAHLIWGAMAYYLKLLIYIPAWELAMHRAVWSVPVAGLTLLWQGRMGDVIGVLRRPRDLLTLAFTGSLIACNWGFYIWSIEVHRTIEASLGYYINPMINVLFGLAFLGERFSRMQTAAIALACVGVLMQAWAVGVFPWLGLFLATTFSLYGFIRKTIAIGPAQGFFVEASLMAVPAAAVLAWLALRGEGHFGVAWGETLGLIGLGVMTAAPLLLFATAIKLVRYSTAGMMQYISPSLVFLTAVFVFGEPMSFWRWMSFVVIWIALALYTWASVRNEAA
jgi:chloramphenicol-sensitive protein RarD